LLHEHGADHVLVLRTTHELLALSAEDFFHRVVREQLQAAALVEGQNFGFGHKRRGNVHTLKQLCEGSAIPLTVVPPVLVEGRPVSSSEVRQTLLSGAVDFAARLLGRHYRIHGVVATGQRRGQSLGFPTANLEQVSTLVPRDGVYAVRVETGGKTWPGAANIGPNPTFAEQQRKLEVHLIGYQGDLYGQPLTVDFVVRLRDTRRFQGVSELVEQLRRDIEQAETAVREDRLG
jgi:riboflavin kinase/FMN adenylyltransferase